MSTPQRPAPYLRRFIAIHTPWPQWPPGESISATLGLTSPSSLSHCSLHLDILFWSGLRTAQWVHTSVVVAHRKLFRDFSRAAGAWWLKIRGRASFVCFVLSISALTSRLIGRGAIPAKRYSLWRGVQVGYLLNSWSLGGMRHLMGHPHVWHSWSCTTPERNIPHRNSRGPEQLCGSSRDLHPMWFRKLSSTGCFWRLLSVKCQTHKLSHDRQSFSGYFISLSRAIRKCQ